MDNQIMNTTEIAQYLGINEKKIYALISEKKLPATKITGKWIFLKEMVDRWIEESTGGKSTVDEIKNALLITGSDDILFNQMLNILGANNPNVFPYFCKTGSLKGLFALKDRNAHLAGSHLIDEGSNEYNLPFLETYLDDCDIVTVNFVKREQGFIIQKENPYNIKSVEDLTGRLIKFVNRQKGSGTRKLLEFLLKKHGINPILIRGYSMELTSHLELGLQVLRGEADCGIGIRAVSSLLNLEFIPLATERFDLVIHKEFYFTQKVQSLLEVLRSNQFKKQADELSGYDTTESGKIIYKN